MALVATLVDFAGLFAAAPGEGGDAARGLIERWRDLGAVLWLVAAAGALVWALVVAAATFATRSREVDPGPATLELGGPEPVAVVNLITSDWRLGHEAVPATLLDLAARRVVAIDQVGERTLIRVRAKSARTDDRTAELEPYERMVLDHVEHQAVDGVVPAEALTTGPEEEARGWWRKFRKSVERDARRRGLSRPRWAPAMHVTLTVAALVVAGLVAVAATTLPDDAENSDNDPVGAALGFGAMTAGMLVAVVELLNGERDTPAGRQVASRWLGLRTLLEEDPLFGEHPPAGVAIWDRLLSYGAAMGVAHGAVRALPLGTESDKEAWSSVGGHWRVVRIRYPHFLPPGYGRRPGIVLLVGLVQVILAALAFPAAAAAAGGLRDAVAGFSTDDSVPAGVSLGVGIGLGVVVAVAVVVALRGATMVVAGATDLFSSPRRVEGRVLRVRRRGDDEHPQWYVAVDDGTRAEIRAWKTAPGAPTQGATVRAEVTRWLTHVRSLAVAAPAPVRPSLPDDELDPDAGGTPLSTLLGAAGSRDDQPMVAVSESTGTPPPLPDAAAVSAAFGRPLHPDPSAHPHPMAKGGRSATFTGDDKTMVQVAWVDPSLLGAHRSLPRLLRRTLTGVGDEAYRAVVGGGVIARRGNDVLMVMGRVSGRGDDERDRALEAVARTTLAAPGGA